MAKRRKGKMGLFDQILAWLVLVGGFAWGIVGLTRLFGADVSIVDVIANAMNASWIATAVYLAVGFGTVWITVKSANGSYK